MRIVSLILIALIAALHGYIAWFEMFAWEAKGPAIFTTLPPDLFPQTVEIAKNQGIYNSFLAAGLFWSLLIKDKDWQRNVASCFLLFVLVAGLVGAATITTKTIYIQTIPALLGLVTLYLGSRK